MIPLTHFFSRKMDLRWKVYKNKPLKTRIYIKKRRKAPGTTGVCSAQAVIFVTRDKENDKLGHHSHGINWTLVISQCFRNFFWFKSFRRIKWSWFYLFRVENKCLHEPPWLELLAQIPPFKPPSPTAFNELKIF